MKEREERFAAMHRLVESPPYDLPLGDWQDLYDLAASYKPDLIVELGRGYGNSTCVLVEVAHAVGCKVVSYGFDSEYAWESRTAPRLRTHLGLGDKWFKRLTVLQQDITEADFQPFVKRKRRVFVYWDAHGADVAEAVIGRLFPLLKEARVAVDDIWTSDTLPEVVAEHEGQLGWEVLTAEPLASCYDEVYPIAKFVTDNHIQVRTSGEQRIWFLLRRG